MQDELVWVVIGTKDAKIERRFYINKKQAQNYFSTLSDKQWNVEIYQYKIDKQIGSNIRNV